MSYDYSDKHVVTGAPVNQRGTVFISTNLK